VNRGGKRLTIEKGSSGKSKKVFERQVHTKTTSEDLQRGKKGELGEPRCGEHRREVEYETGSRNHKSKRLAGV